MPEMEQYIAILYYYQHWERRLRSPAAAAGMVQEDYARVISFRYISYSL